MSTNGFFCTCVNNIFENNSNDQAWMKPTSPNFASDVKQTNTTGNLWLKQEHYIPCRKLEIKILLWNPGYVQS